LGDTYIGYGAESCEQAARNLEKWTKNWGLPRSEKEDCSGGLFLEWKAVKGN